MFLTENTSKTEAQAASSSSSLHSEGYGSQWAGPMLSASLGDSSAALRAFMGGFVGGLSGLKYPKPQTA